MNMYHFQDCQSLADTGDVIVIATCIEEAREKAYKALYDYFKNLYDWIDEDNEDELDLWNSIMKDVLKDLEQEPVRVESVVVQGNM